MSLKNLQDAGVLLPKEEWGVHDLHTSVNKPRLLASLALGLASVIMMYLGNGSALTFVGAALFLAFMVWITHISIRAVHVQSAQFREEREAAHLEDAPLPGETTSDD